MNARMDIPTNREHYRKRKWMAESVNGNLKSNLRFTRFQGKGLKFCAGELALAALTMNIKKARNLNVLDKIHEYQKRQLHGNVKGQRRRTRLSGSKDLILSTTGACDSLFRWMTKEFHCNERVMKTVV